MSRVRRAPANQEAREALSAALQVAHSLMTRASGLDALLAVPCFLRHLASSLAPDIVEVQGTQKFDLQCKGLVRVGVQRKGLVASQHRAWREPMAGSPCLAKCTHLFQHAPHPHRHPCPGPAQRMHRQATGTDEARLALEMMTKALVYNGASYRLTLQALLGLPSAPPRWAK